MSMAGIERRVGNKDYMRHHFQKWLRDKKAEKSRKQGLDGAVKKAQLEKSNKGGEPDMVMMNTPAPTAPPSGHVPQPQPIVPFVQFPSQIYWNPQLLGPPSFRMPPMQCWGSGQFGLIKSASLVKVKLKPGCDGPRQKQYPMSPEGEEGNGEIISELEYRTVIFPTFSPFNTPILPVKKHSRKYHMVQDFGQLNQVVESEHPLVARPLRDSL
jgi:hypothetical protein